MEPSEPRTTNPRNARLAAGLATLFVGSLVLTAFFHLADLRSLDFVSGVWMALAQATAAGDFYPALFEPREGRFGGTRYMPLGFALHAALGAVTGEFLVSGKLLSLSAAALLVGGVWRCLQNLPVGRPAAYVFCAALLSCHTFVKGALAIRGDLLPVALDVWALSLVTGADLRRRNLLPAAALLALAWNAKITAVAGVCAALVAVRLRPPASAGRFALATALAAGAVASLCNQLSDGRMLEQLSRLGVADRLNLAAGAARFAELVWTNDPELALLFFADAFLVLIHAVRRASTAWDVYFVVSVAVAVVVFADAGTMSNHLVEPATAGVLLAATPFTRARDKEKLDRAVRWTTAAALTAVVASGAIVHASYWLNVDLLRGKPFEDSKNADPRLASLAAYRPVVDRLGGIQDLLCDDGSIAVALGKRPVVQDRWMFLIAVENGLASPQALVDRIRRREFPCILLAKPLSPTGDCRFPFGTAVGRTIREFYREDFVAGRFHVYAPKPSESP